jgi:peptidoglycan/LPS O-acetylase OafA/YrhL
MSTLHHGGNAPDVFFLLSGFLTTLSLLQDRAISAEYGRFSVLKAILNRALRLFPLLIVPYAYGLLRDPFLKSSWVTMTGWLLMVVNWAPLFTDDIGASNLSIGPCWSILVDLQCTLLLIFVVPFCHRRWPFHAWPFVTFAALLVLVRWWAVESTMFARSCTFSEFISVYALQGLPYDFPIKTATTFTTTFGGPPYSANLCKIGFGEMFVDFWTKTRSAPHAAAGPFFLGALMANNYKYVMRQRKNHEVASVTAAPQKGAFAAFIFPLRYWARTLSLCLAVISILAQLVPQNSTAPIDSRFAHALVIFSPLILSAAWALIIYSAVAPPGSDWHSRILRALLSWRHLRTLADLSPWLYTLHWPIMCELLRNRVLYVERFGHKAYCLTETAIASALVLGITLPLAALCVQYIEPACEKRRRKLVTKLFTWPKFKGMD